MIFEMTETQKEKLLKWQEAIEVVYGTQGQFEYIFTPVGNDYSIRVYSDIADFELDLTEPLN
jgi:hypothetical protein